MSHLSALLALLTTSSSIGSAASFLFAPFTPYRDASTEITRRSLAPNLEKHDNDVSRNNVYSTTDRRRCSTGFLAATATATDKSPEYLQNKEALKKDLRDEYESFFDNFESERYLPDVEFIDPVTSFTGFQNYKNNLDMLGGRSALGRILFKDASIILHDIEEPAPFRLRTRWTLKVCFKALPWQPVPRFTGISDYTIDGKARVIKQEDYWDSINLVEGRYQSVSPLQGIRDFVGQVLPSLGEQTRRGELLRRADAYEVWRTEGGEVIASRELEGKVTDGAVVSNSRILLETLLVDGLGAADKPELVTSSGGREKNRVSVALKQHDWMT